MLAGGGGCSQPHAIEQGRWDRVKQSKFRRVVNGCYVCCVSGVVLLVVCCRVWRAFATSTILSFLRRERRARDRTATTAQTTVQTVVCGGGVHACSSSATCHTCRKSARLDQQYACCHLRRRRAAMNVYPLCVLIQRAAFQRLSSKVARIAISNSHLQHAHNASKGRSV